MLKQRVAATHTEQKPPPQVSQPNTHSDSYCTRKCSEAICCCMKAALPIKLLMNILHEGVLLNCITDMLWSYWLQAHNDR